MNETILATREAMYTAPEILLFIAAIGSVIVNIVMAWKQGIRSEEILKKASVIEGHVNSKETKYVEQISFLQRENEILKTVIADKDRVAALLAQSVILKPAEVKTSGAAG